AISDPEGQVFSVEFYLDNESQHVDYEAPYEYNLNTFLVGRHTVTAEVHGIYGGKESKSIDIITFILGK
ncbi:MAG: hypothetical protein KAU84_03920, partial [Thermoplasmatales archaeon]|nr:hypothetical protein [Thermoplasmatales archaeon]